MRILPALGANPLCLACAPDSRFLYIGCQDGAIHAWERMSDDWYHIFQEPTGQPVLTLACSGDGLHLAVACGRAILLQTPTTGEVLPLDRLGLGTALVAFGADEHLFYTAHAAGMLRAHRLGLGAGRLPVLCAQDTLALTARADAPWVLLGHGRARTGGATWWRLDGARLTEGGALQLQSPVCSVAIAPGGERFAVGRRDGTVSLIEPQGLARTHMQGAFRVLPAGAHLDRTHGVLGLAFTNDGRELLTASSAGDVQRWDVASQRLLHKLDWELGGLRALVFAPDGQTAAAITENSEIVVWDVD